MDTTMWITLLCDADKRLLYPMLTEARLVTIEKLNFEYLCHLWNEESRKAVVTLWSAFRPALEQASKDLTKLCSLISSAIEKTSQSPKWYNPKNRNNYRKVHHMSMRRVMGCRQRPRESRRVLYGSSADTVIFDELHGIEEG